MLAGQFVSADLIWVLAVTIMQLFLLAIHHLAVKDVLVTVYSIGSVLHHRVVISKNIYNIYNLNNKTIYKLVDKKLNDVSCSSNCECRSDLNLYCYYHSSASPCHSSYTGTRCACGPTQFWDGTSCGNQSF